MAVAMKNTPSIYGIFEKDTEMKSYTKNASLKQDMLSYYYKVIVEKKNDNSFRFSDLALWLVNNSLQFVTFYQGRGVRDSYKIENTKKRILNHLKEIEFLGLIRRKS